MKPNLIDIKKANAGYFVRDNVSLWYSSIYGWYLKGVYPKKNRRWTENISEKTAKYFLKTA